MAEGKLRGKEQETASTEDSQNMSGEGKGNQMAARGGGQGMVLMMSSGWSSFICCSQQARTERKRCGRETRRSEDLLTVRGAGPEGLQTEVSV